MPGPYAGASDPRIDGLHRHVNYGTSVDLITKNQKSSLFRFDLSSIPSGTAIACAAFDYFVQDPSVRNFSAAVLERPWTEDGATWNEYAPGHAWGAPGATEIGDGGDVGPLLARLPGDGAGAHQRVDFNVDIVQNWIDQPRGNLGFIVFNSEANDGVNMASSESPESMRPAFLVGLR